MPKTRNNLRGIIAMVLAMGFFVINDTFVKLAREHWDAGQVMAIRGGFALAMLGVWLIAAGLAGRISLAVRPLPLLRGAIEGAIAAAFISALGEMPLATITAILMLSPLIITALSIVIHQEVIGWRRWSAVVVGFCGMLLVVQPGVGVTAPWPLALALASAVGVGLRDTLTKSIPAEIPSVIIALTSTGGTLAAGLALSATGASWQPATPAVLLYCLGAAGFVILGNYAMVVACRGVELSVVSPFRYVVMVWAVLLGIAVFGDWPSPLAISGIALIGLSGLYTLHRERLRRRAE